jgi:hypothetical protein
LATGSIAGDFFAAVAGAAGVFALVAGLDAIARLVAEGSAHCLDNGQGNVNESMKGNNLTDRQGQVPTQRTEENPRGVVLKLGISLTGLAFYWWGHIPPCIPKY